MRNTICRAELKHIKPLVFVQGCIDAAAQEHEKISITYESPPENPKMGAAALVIWGHSPLVEFVGPVGLSAQFEGAKPGPVDAAMLERYGLKAPTNLTFDELGRLTDDETEKLFGEAVEFYYGWCLERNIIPQQPNWDPARVRFNDGMERYEIPLYNGSGDLALIGAVQDEDWLFKALNP